MLLMKFIAGRAHVNKELRSIWNAIRPSFSNVPRLLESTRSFSQNLAPSGLAVLNVMSEGTVSVRQDTAETRPAAEMAAANCVQERR